MRPTPSKTLIARLKRNAKTRAARDAVSHSQALELEAAAAGYPSWHALHHAALQRAKDEPLPLPIDPKLPRRFDSTPNERRSQAELDAWWDRPYALTLPDGTFALRCLHGGAHDRSSFMGVAPDAAAASKLAIAKLEEWRRIRERPFPYIREDGRCDVVRAAQRPDQDELVLAEGLTLEEATAWLREHSE